MSKSNAFENAFLRLIFNNVSIANLGDATGVRGSAVAGNLYVSLHTADPGETGTQATNEAAYTWYARVAVERSEDGWTVTDNAVTNAADIQFPKCTAGSETLTHFSVGFEATGASTICYKGSLTSSIAVSANIIPAIAAGELDITED